jgi:hypothetical protein
MVNISRAEFVKAELIIITKEEVAGSKFSETKVAFSGLISKSYELPYRLIYSSKYQNQWRSLHKLILKT